jgi:hypothetical protein
MLALGMLIIPMGIVFGGHLAFGNFAALVFVVAGALGMHALLSLVTMLLAGEQPKLSPRTTLIFAAIGYASLLPMVIGPVDSQWWRLAGILPMLAGAHVIYMARAHLFNRGSATNALRG